MQNLAKCIAGKGKPAQKNKLRGQTCPRSFKHRHKMRFTCILFRSFGPFSSSSFRFDDTICILCKYFGTVCKILALLHNLDFKKFPNISRIRLRSQAHVEMLLDKDVGVIAKVTNLRLQRYKFKVRFPRDFLLLVLFQVKYSIFCF